MSIEKRNGKYVVRWSVWITEDGRKRRKQLSKSFAFKDKAERFKAKIKLGEAFAPNELSPQRVTIGEIIAAWKERAFPHLAPTSRETHESRLRLHFEMLLPIQIHALTPIVIDEWIAGMVANRNKYGKGAVRTSFKAELALLGTILNDYGEHREEGYVSPIRRRHRIAVNIGKPKPKCKDLQEVELEAMLEAIVEHNYRGLARVLRAMAIVQYYQALRISEVAALRWQDVRFDRSTPSRSRLVLFQHVLYVRDRLRSKISPGIKNGTGKEQPMLPRTFAALSELAAAAGANRGLVFCDETGNHFSYRSITYVYNRAFERAGLPYTGTHVMRHGGTRTVLEDTGGDRDVARQQLGNRDAKTVDVYAVRSAAAFTHYAERKWAECVQDGVLEPPRLRVVK